MSQTHGVLQELRKRGAAGGTERFELAQQQAKLGGPLRGVDELRRAAFLLEGNEADGIVLFEEEPGERGGEDAGALQLGTPRGGPAIFHRGAGVANNVEA